MTRRLDRASVDGFTLTELLVAITILGIIVVAIGAMITTAFRTSTMVSAELQGSRGPKVVSRYWAPDVEQAKSVTPGGGCGPAGPALVTFTSPIFVSSFDHPDQETVETDRTITWRVETAGTRDQLVRYVCDGSPDPARFVVVSDLKVPPAVDDRAKPRYTIQVTVPDRSRTTNVYKFDVTAMSQITTTTSVP